MTCRMFSVCRNEMKNTTETAFSLGSNLGDRLANLIKAREALCRLAELTLVDQASVYETTPVDTPAEYNSLLFLNTVLVFESVIPPSQAQTLLARVKKIEKTMGRVKSDIKNAPRIIDIDILYMGSTGIKSETLTIPHPEWKNRRFVLEPLAELRSGLILPGSSDNIAQTLKKLDDNDKAVRITGKRW